MSTVTAHTAPSKDRTLLHAAGTAIEVDYGDPDDVFMRVISPSGAWDQAPGARLLCAAVSQARTRHTRRLRTSLEATSPTCWTYLEALRGRVGDDVESIALRRAGSSILVTLDLLPPRPSRPSTGVRPRSAGPAGHSSNLASGPATSHLRRT